MLDKSPNALKVALERVYVVYDGKSGHIVHVHEVTVFDGAEAPSADQDEARAVALAQRHGHRLDDLRVLAVEPGEFNPNMEQRVDLETRRLIRRDAGRGEDRQ